MSTANSRAWKTFRAAMALLLAFALVPPATAGAAYADEGNGSDDGGDAITQLLTAGSYVEHEALVVMDNTVASNGLRSHSVDLLASAQPLMDASAETFASATGENLPIEEPAANGPSLLRALQAHLIKKIPGVSRETPGKRYFPRENQTFARVLPSDSTSPSTLNRFNRAYTL